jgi:hypothetical protein
LITHLHSDHVCALNDVITTHWVMTQGNAALQIYGPLGTARFVECQLQALEADIGYRLEHHDLLVKPPQVKVTELGPAPRPPARLPVRAPLRRGSGSGRRNAPGALLDEGDPSARPVLLPHGEPMRSYPYRHMIPPLVEAEHRVVVPGPPCGLAVEPGILADDEPPAIDDAVDRELRAFIDRNRFAR